MSCQFNLQNRSCIHRPCPVHTAALSAPTPRPGGTGGTLAPHQALSQQHPGFSLKGKPDHVTPCLNSSPAFYCFPLHKNQARAPHHSPRGPCGLVPAALPCPHTWGPDPCLDTVPFPARIVLSLGVAGSSGLQILAEMSPLSDTQGN